MHDRLKDHSALKGIYNLGLFAVVFILFIFFYPCVYAEESTLTKPTLQVTSMKAEGLTVDINLYLDGPERGNYSLVIQRQLNNGSYIDYASFKLTGVSWSYFTSDSNNPKKWWQSYGDWKSGIVVYGQDWETSHELRFHDEHLPEGYNCRYRFRLIYKNKKNEDIILKSPFVYSKKIKAVIRTPEAPAFVKGYVTSAGVIQLKWQKTELAEGYNVYQYVNGKWKKSSVKNGAANTSFRKKNTAKNTSYIYRIRAWRKFKGKTVLGKPSISISLSTKAPTVKGEFSKGSVYGPYLPEKELADVKRAVQIFKDSYLKSSMKDYDKIRTVFDYIRANCVYAGNTDKYPNTAWGCLVNGKAWCSGYARGAKALLDAAGIPCYYVHASKNSISPEHQWVQVKLGGKWYVMDCQGGFFLCGKDSMFGCGLSWDSKGLPALSKTDHPKGGIFVEFEEVTFF